MSTDGTTGAASSAPKHVSLFLAFLKIGLLGFGGVAAWARHVLVVEYQFMSAKEFAESFGLASSLPGANTVNLATMLGDRFRGPSGAAVALAGLVGAPLCVLVLIAELYARFHDLPDVKAALYGSAAAAAGIVLGTSLKILRDLEPDWFAVGCAATVCITAASKVPMLWIIAVVVPTSIVFGSVRKRRG